MPGPRTTIADDGKDKHVAQPPDSLILGCAKAIYEKDEKPRPVMALPVKK